MIPVATAEEMRRADRRATEHYGVPSLLLMENAGRGAVDALERVLGPVASRRIAVVCGKGNNGGDGFVVARHLLGRGARVSAWLVGRAGDVQGDARVNLEALRRAGESVAEVPDAAGSAADGLRAELGVADVVVDALLGTGVRGPATGAIAAAIEAINAAGAAGRPVCALDLPSGLPSDGEVAAGPVVRARVTVTFGLPKLGLVLPGGAAYAGRVEIADLGIPRAWLGEGIKGGVVVSTVMANLGLERALAALGVKMARTAVGDRYVLEEMRRLGANLGGEQSGHVIFLDHARTGDGLLTALQLLRAVREAGQPLSALAAQVEKCPQVLLNVRVRARPLLGELRSVAEALARWEGKLDGRARFLVRYSGTESLARVMVEGDDQATIDAAAREIAAAIHEEIGAMP